MTYIFQYADKKTLVRFSQKPNSKPDKSKLSRKQINIPRKSHLEKGRVMRSAAKPYKTCQSENSSHHDHRISMLGSRLTISYHYCLGCTQKQHCIA